MKIKNIKWMTGSLMTAALVAGISACSDDHFDISPEASGKQTLWKTIQSNSELSEFADILQHVYYSQTEEKATPETYADVLNGSQTFTVWAPVNGTFNYDYYKGLLELDQRDSTYKVERELIRNHMTRYNQPMIGTGLTKMELFNEKSAWIDYDNRTIKGASITEANIGASNGVLHITETPIAYQPSLYEYLSTREDLSTINTFVKRFQTTEFDEAASTQGPTVNGKITWVDSVTYITNYYTRAYMGAYLEREDSNYVMIVPTNKAWAAELGKTQQYFKYNPIYKQDVNTQTETGKDTTISNMETTFTEAELDSLIDVRSNNAICQDLVFNANWQYEQIPITSIEDISKADSLETTTGIKFKKPGTLNVTNKRNVLEIADYAAMFGNTDPVEVSNGYAYIVDQFPYPYHIYAPDIDEMTYESCDALCNPSISQSKTYTKPTVTIDDETIESDSTFKYTNLTIMKGKASTSNPGAYFRVSNVLSCKYDIYVVINFNTDYMLPNKFYAYIAYDKAIPRTSSKTGRVSNQRLTNPNEDAVDAKGNSLYGKNEFVNRGIHFNTKGEIDYTDTICIAKDFEFPACYYGLSTAYPVINIKSNVRSTDKDYTREIWVNSIIMKPKEWSAPDPEDALDE